MTQSLEEHCTAGAKSCEQAARIALKLSTPGVLDMMTFWQGNTHNNDSIVRQ